MDSPLSISFSTHPPPRHHPVPQPPRIPPPNLFRMRWKVTSWNTTIRWRKLNSASIEPNLQLLRSPQPRWSRFVGWGWGCHNYFPSSVPQTSYQMTQHDGGGDDDDSETAIAEESYAMASQMRKSTIEAFESNRASKSTAGYVVLGAFVGCVAVAGLFTTLGGFRVIGEAGTISRVNVNTIILQSTRSRVNVNRTPLTIDEVKEAVIVWTVTTYVFVV